MFHDVKPSARRGYLFDTTEPLYPFGFGLGYSTFELGAPRLSSAAIDTRGSVQVAVDVRNAGQREGEETIQVYVRDKVATVARSVKSLKAFTRVRLAAGESRTVTFTLEAASLAMWDGSMRRVVEPGEFEVMAGPDSARLKAVTLTVEAR
jgi:beta-glucosidase